MSKKIIVSEAKELQTPTQQAENLISQAIQNNTPVETMEKLLVMRRELKAEFAKEQFDFAMSNFQMECPIIKKTKKGGSTNSGIVAYSYAPLDSIVSQTKSLISKNGFSYQIKTDTLENKVKATCIVKHSSGHSESSTVEVPLGAKTGIMSMPQVVASSLTFAKRYAFCDVFGIITGDDDNDASFKTPKDNPKKSNFEILKTQIEKEKNTDNLIKYSEKLKSSEIYSDEEKNILQNLISAKVDTL